MLNPNRNTVLKLFKKNVHLLTKNNGHSLKFTILCDRSGDYYTSNVFSRSTATYVAYVNVNVNRQYYNFMIRARCRNCSFHTEFFKVRLFGNNLRKIVREMFSQILRSGNPFWVNRTYECKTYDARLMINSVMEL